MRKIGRVFSLLLLVGILGTGCLSQNSAYTLRVIPPQNLQLPLQGTWEILSPLQENTVSSQDQGDKWFIK